MSVENDIYNFLLTKIQNAPTTSALYQAELGDSEYSEIQKDFGIQVGPVEGDLAPNAGATAIEKHNADVTLICYYAIGGEKDQRADERDKVEALAMAAALEFFLDPTMGGRVR